MNSGGRALAEDEKTAKAFADTIQKIGDGQSEAGLARLLVGVVVVLSGSPWWLIAEPLLSRAFARLNNKAGKDAAAAIAKEVEDDDKRRRLAAEVGGRLDQTLAELFSRAEERGQVATGEVVDTVQSSAADLLARFGLQLHRLEERLLSELAPHADVWRSLSSGTRLLVSGPFLKPSDLLVAAHRAVRFVGRERTLEELDAWVKGPLPAALALVTGRGGSGKTRLAIEAAGRWRAQRVPAGFLTGTADAPLDGALSGSGKRVVVIDYAEGKPDLLQRVLKQLARGTAPPARILLLARERGEWWDNLVRIPETDDRIVVAAASFQLDSEELALSVPDRQEAWQEAVATFAKATGASTSPAPPDYETEIFRRPLPLLMHALVALDRPVPASEPELLRRVLVHEERHHSSAVDALGSIGAERVAMLRVVQELVAVVTLLDGVGTSDTLRPLARDRLRRLLDRTPELQVEQLLGVVAGLYPRTEGGVAPLEPDLLGETLMAAATARSGELLDETVKLAGSRAERASLLKVLARHARRTGDNLRLEQLFRGHLEVMALDALEVAVEGGDPVHPVAAALDAELRWRGSAAADVCLAIGDRCPQASLTLADVAATATATALGAARQAAKADPSPDRFVEVAHLANNLANRLSDVGRHEEALTAAEEALSLRRQLATARPDAFLSDLAMSLNNLANRLSAVGQHDDALAAAQEAVSLRRELATARHDAFLPNLAASLNNLANVLSDVGRHEEALTAAEEALSLRRELATARPEAFLPDLAMSLNNVANRLSQVGQRDHALSAAQQAADLYRQLATARPDAFLPNLAISLNNLASKLSDVGRSDHALAAAQEAVNLRRQLATVRPQAFLPHLAVSLNNLANRLRHAGQRDDALAAAREAAGLYRQLATARPEAFLPNLATSLSNLASMLSDLGQRDEALAGAQEAVGLRRQLAAARPDAFLRDLAVSLNNLANRLSDAGQRDDALAAAREAAGLYRRLAIARPDAFLPDLATSLNNLANALSDLGQRDDALAAANEAVRIHRQLATGWPDAFLPNLAMSLANLATMLSHMGQCDDALVAAQQGTDIYRQLATARPDAFLPDFAGSLNNLANVLSEVGQRDDALAAAQEAVRLRRQLTLAWPDAFLPDLAMSLNNLANRLSDVGQRNDALVAAQEAVTLRRQLTLAWPDAFLPDLATSLNNLAKVLSDVGQRDDALAAGQEAADLYRHLVTGRGDTFLPDFARSLGMLGTIQMAAGKPSSAAAAYADGAHCLLPVLDKGSPVLEPLLVALLSGHVSACNACGIASDPELAALLRGE